MHITQAIILKKSEPLPDKNFYDLMRLASDEYKHRAVKMKRSAAENLLLGEALAKRMLSECIGTAPENLEFSRGPHGKPFLKNREDLHFNISHSGMFIACAVSPAPVGVDVQILSSPRLTVAKRFFTENEYHYIIEADRSVRFCRVWTMKESYLKQMGLGISAMPLNSFDVLGLPRNIFHEITLDGTALCQICGNLGFGIQVLRISAEQFLSCGSLHGCENAQNFK